MTERYTVWRARQLGLAEGATLEEILAANSRAVDARREELGLSPDASWDEYVRARTDFERRARAQALGLPDTATWGDIVEGENAQRLAAK